MPTPFEKAVKEEYQKQGWETLTSGWPDLLLWKKVGHKTVLKFVEIKGKNDVLREHQKLMLNLLCEAGLVVRTAHEGYGYGDNFGSPPFPFFELVTDTELDKLIEKGKSDANKND